VDERGTQIVHEPLERVLVAAEQCVNRGTVTDKLSLGYSNVCSNTRGTHQVEQEIYELIHESGAVGGDLVYVQSSNGTSLPGARLTTAPDLLGLKAEALGMDKPLIAIGPGIDLTYADIVIDADAPEPAIIKSKVLSSGAASRT
jgi:hypothetical protein